MSERALVCLNGDLQPMFTRLEWEQYHRIIAVDGALDTLLEMNRIPSVVIGDLDSASPAALERARQHGIQISRIEEQETSDFAKALRYLRESGVNSVDIVGHRGGRLDHEFALLSECARVSQAMEITLHDPMGMGYILNGPGSYDLQNRVGRHCSILPLAASHGVTLNGFAWDVVGMNYRPGGAHSLSNRIHADPASVHLDKGTLLIYLLNNPDA